MSTYEAQVERIWHILIGVNESMHIVSRIQAFPLGKFVEPQDVAFFWRLLVNNTGNAVVLRLHSLLNDDGGDTLTLRKLANSTRGWLKPQYQNWYTGRLREAKFDAHLNDVAERLRDLRHTIAHIFVEQAGVPIRNETTISESEAVALFEATVRLFPAASLTTEYVIDTRAYTIGGKCDPRPIDKLLDLVAKDSY
ncbi:MAG: hypothetical protein QM770_05520 [Tepidisphaeraceae bacterium]